MKKFAEISMWNVPPTPFILPTGDNAGTKTTNVIRENAEIELATQGGAEKIE